MEKSEHATISVRERTKLKLTEVMIERDLDSYNDVVTMLVNKHLTEEAEPTDYEECVQIILKEIER